MLLDFIQKNREDVRQETPFAAINSVAWTDFTDRVKAYQRILEQAAPTRLLLKLPNTVSGVALLLASGYLKCETIIMPDYQTDLLARQLIEQYKIDKYFSIFDDELRFEASEKSDPASLDQAYLCLLTSGTTGVPKCVKHSWNTLLSKIKIDARFKGNSWFVGYPITHFAGLQVTLQSLSNKGSLIIPESYDAAHCIAMIAQHHPNYLNCTPTFMRQMFMSSKEFDWKSCGIKRITLGGEVVDQGTIDLLKKNIPDMGISHTYASTELGVLISVSDEKEGFPVSIIDHQTFDIVDDELLVKPSASAMLQYLNKDKMDQGQWMHTKDLVEIKGDRVLFRGRTDDLINIGGYKVRPAVVEQVIRDVEGVTEVVVIGQKNPIMGNILTAKVQASGKIDEKTVRKNIITSCKGQLPEYMVPRMVQFVDALAMTHTRKLIRSRE